MTSVCLASYGKNFALAFSLILGKQGPSDFAQRVACGQILLKVKVTAKVQAVSECLSGLYLLNQTTFCYQPWYSDAAS